MNPEEEFEKEVNKVKEFLRPNEDGLYLLSEQNLYLLCKGFFFKGATAQILLLKEKINGIPK